MSQQGPNRPSFSSPRIAAGAALHTRGVASDIEKIKRALSNIEIVVVGGSGRAEYINGKLRITIEP